MNVVFDAHKGNSEKEGDSASSPSRTPRFESQPSVKEADQKKDDAGAYG